MMSNLMIGADPELFAFRNKSFISAHDLISGTKEDPFKVKDGAVQVDGVAAEFNITPAKTARQFTANLQSVMGQLLGLIQQNGEDIQLRASPVANFSKAYFKSLPAEAKLLGCQPDFDVWKGQQNPPPKSRGYFRTGAGHIHVGWTEFEDISDTSHLFDCGLVVKQLDHVLFPMSFAWDNNTERRKLYGHAGSYRPKSYGVEYRPLSNAWVADPDLHLWIFEATKKAIHDVDKDKKLWTMPLFSEPIEHLRKNPSNKLTQNQLKTYANHLYEIGYPKLPKGYING